MVHRISRPNRFIAELDPAVALAVVGDLEITRQPAEITDSRPHPRRTIAGPAAEDVLRPVAPQALVLRLAVS